MSQKLIRKTQSSCIYKLFLGSTYAVCKYPNKNANKIIDASIIREYQALTKKNSFVSNQAYRCLKRNSTLVSVLKLKTTPYKKPAIYLEYLPGETLDKRIAKNLETDPIALAHDITRALVELKYTTHTLSHRDIKPENIMMLPSKRAVLFDLGIAKVKGEQEFAKMLGTKKYVAPEQWEHPEHASFQSDLYSLGIVLKELSNIPSTPNRTCTKRIVKKLVQSLTQTNPNDRPQSLIVLYLKLIFAKNAPCIYVLMSYVIKIIILGGIAIMLFFMLPLCSLQSAQDKVPTTTNLSKCTSIIDEYEILEEYEQEETNEKSVTTPPPTPLIGSPLDE